MIKKFIQRWDAQKDALREAFAASHPESYREIVERVVRALADEDDEWSWPDPERITEIDHGHYQGTLVYVVGAGGYQPSTYWGVTVGYGSCSGCDTLQAINGYSDDPPTKEQTDAYMQLALDVVRGFKQFGGYVWDETTEGAA